MATASEMVQDHVEDTFKKIDNAVVVLYEIEQQIDSIITPIVSAIQPIKHVHTKYEDEIELQLGESKHNLLIDDIVALDELLIPLQNIKVVITRMLRESISKLPSEV